MCVWGGGGGGVTVSRSAGVAFTVTVACSELEGCEGSRGEPAEAEGSRGE